MISIVQTKKFHLAEVCSLIDNEFGKGYSQTKTFISEFNFSFSAISNNKVIGFSAGKELTTAELVNEFPSFEPQNQKKVGVLDLIVVHPNFQRQGIGKKLFEKRLLEFKNKEIKELFLFHWVRKNQAVPVFAKSFEFEKIALLKNYWTEESLTKQYNCSECPSSPPCNCSCAVYHKIIT